MKLFLIFQSVNNDYNTFDSAIVAAENEEKARFIHPYASDIKDDWWKDESEYGDMCDWAHPDNVKVTYIGEAKKGTESGVILASFNAG